MVFTRLFQKFVDMKVNSNSLKPIKMSIDKETLVTCVHMEASIIITGDNKGIISVRRIQVLRTSEKSHIFRTENFSDL